MTRLTSSRTILCTWEMGSDLGHIARLSSLTKALEIEGYHVILALKDLSRCYPFFKDTNAQIIQAPNWLLKLKMQRPIACLADTLLLSGYVNPEALLMLTKAWQTIVQLVKPDLIIFNYSPTALLSLRDETRIKKIIVGTGFSEPEAGYPIADWRYHKVDDNLIAEQERVTLHPINTVLKQLNKTALKKLSDLWQVNKVILHELPPFDPYHEIRTNAVYCLSQDSTNNHMPVVFPETGKKKIIAYLKPSYAKFEQLLKALAHSDADVFVACPVGPENLLKSCESDHFKYSTSLVNLAEGLERSDLFVGHGNITTVHEALYAEIPTLVFPQQQEQLLTGKKLQKLGAGMMIIDFESSHDLARYINKVLYDVELRGRVKSIKQKYHVINQSVASVVKESISQLLS